MNRLTEHRMRRGELRRSSRVATSQCQGDHLGDFQWVEVVIADQDQRAFAGRRRRTPRHALHVVYSGQIEVVQVGDQRLGHRPDLGRGKGIDAPDVRGGRVVASKIRTL